MAVSTENAGQDDLEERVRDVVLRAVDVLGEDRPGVESPIASDRLTETWQSLCARLDRDAPADPAQAAALCELFVEATQLQQDRQEHEISGRLAVLGEIHGALVRLSELSSPSELIDAAPAELCRCCSFDRALISRVRGSTWVPESLYVAGPEESAVDAELREYVRSIEIPLSSMLMETEMVRRGTPAIVENPAAHPRTFKELMLISQTTGYVAAPVMPANRVIGFLHADTHGSGRPLTVSDRDNLWAFAEGFGLVFERVVLVQRLSAQRAQVREAFRSAEVTIDELCDAQLELARQERDPVGLSRASQSRPSSHESRLHALLTPREREVLALMASGATNNQIADQLVISQGTVKSHVKHVLRKLRASTRAEAVSRSLHLSMSERP